MIYCFQLQGYARLLLSTSCLGRQYGLFRWMPSPSLSIEYLWGFPLGQRLRDIRVKGYYLRGKNADARRRQLDALGFYWEPKRGRPRKSKVTTTQSVEQ